MICRILLPVVVFGMLFCASPVLFSEERKDVRWEDVSPLVLNRKVDLAMADGSILSGQVLEIRENTMRLKTGHGKEGEKNIARSDIRSVQYVERKGAWRAILAAAGTGAGIGVARAVSFGTSEKRIEKTVAAHAAILPAAAVAGYLVGRSVDRHVVFLRILN